MGAMGPISLDELPNFRTNISRLIDFNNKVRSNDSSEHIQLQLKTQ